MDISDLIADFATGIYVVTRRPAASFVTGRTVPSTPSTLTITASVQDPKGRDLMRLPEARRSVATKQIYTDTQLFAGGQGATNEADLVTIDGMQWEVQHVETWVDPLTLDSFYSCMAQAVR